MQSHDPATTGTRSPQWTEVVLVAALAFIAFLLYTPGLSGGFLLDDMGSLKPMSYRGEIDSWQAAWIYITGGHAGPTGRPISLLSFLWDARTWPADAAPFKQTNLVLHCFIGLVLHVTIRVLLRSIGYTRPLGFWIAFLATAFWLLNPYLVSTTLYIVQRMTQLAGLFTLLGILGYLAGRSWLDTSPRAGIATMTVSVCLGTLLATLSKENGVLLPLLILVLEFSFRYHWRSQGPSRIWRLVLLWVPTLFVLGYLGMRLSGAGEVIPLRGWSIAERMLTQPVILLDYLQHLLIPRIETKGLYRDEVATIPFGWLTAGALLAVAALIAGAIAARKKTPLLSFGILFFFAAHLLESTVIPLELYFEHRNYVPSMMLFLPAASGLMLIRGRIRASLATAIIFSLVLTLCATTFLRASLWGDDQLLQRVWAQKNPGSVRAQISYVEALYSNGEPQKALSVLEEATRTIPLSANLTIMYAVNRIARSNLSAEEFSELADRIETQRYERRQSNALRLLVDIINDRRPSKTHAAIMERILGDWHDNWGEIAYVREQAPYLSGILASGQGNAKEALEHFQVALGEMGTVTGGLNMTRILLDDRHYAEAMLLLDEVSNLLADLDRWWEKPERDMLQWGVDSMQAEARRGMNDAKENDSGVENEMEPDA